MIKVEIPGREPVVVSHLVLDYNGTIAEDGILLDGMAERIEKLKDRVTIHVLTADTYGTVARQCAGLGVLVETFPREGAGRCKEEIVKGLTGGVMTVGNGFNDISMSDLADLAVAVLHREGLCAALLSHTDILVTSPLDALDLLIKPDRMKATLRN